MMYSMHEYVRAVRVIRQPAGCSWDRTRRRSVREGETTRVRPRTVRWIESLWEGANTTAREEDQKEQVISMFRDLARESRREGEVREYVPWRPLW
jgi:hypothetical protein